jgi:hypothetical protein
MKEYLDADANREDKICHHIMEFDPMLQLATLLPTSLFNLPLTMTLWCQQVLLQEDGS